MYCYILVCDLVFLYFVFFFWSFLLSSLGFYSKVQLYIFYIGHVTHLYAKAQRTIFKKYFRLPTRNIEQEKDLQPLSTCLNECKLEYFPSSQLVPPSVYNKYVYRLQGFLGKKGSGNVCNVTSGITLLPLRQTHISLNI